MVKIKNFEPRVLNVGVIIFTTCTNPECKATVSVPEKEGSSTTIVTCPSCGLVFDRITKEEVLS